MPKFKITAPRFVNGVYVFATPKDPAVIELDEVPSKERVHEWRNLYLIDETVEPPKPAHASIPKKHPQSSAVAHGKRAADQEPA